MCTLMFFQIIISIFLSAYLSVYFSMLNSNYYLMFLFIPFFIIFMILTLILIIIYCDIVCLIINNKNHNYNKYADHLVKNLVTILLKILNVKVIKQNFDIVKDDNVLYVANHVSNLDPIVFIKIFKNKLSVVSKPENFKIPFIGPIIKTAGYISINRNSPREGAKAIFKARDFLKNDICNVLIFPEGTRNKTDNILLEMKAGSLKPAFSSNKKIVVCSIHNTKNYKFKLFSHKVFIKAIKVLDPKDYESDVFAIKEIQNLIVNDLRQDNAR